MKPELALINNFRKRLRRLKRRRFSPPPKQQLLPPPKQQPPRRSRLCEILLSFESVCTVQLQAHSLLAFGRSRGDILALKQSVLLLSDSKRYVVVVVSERCFCYVHLR